MVNRRISRKYALALFRMGEEAQKTDAVRADLESCVALLEQSPTLVSFVESPNIARQEKTRIVDSFLKGRVGETTAIFVMLILRRNRMALLPEILSEYVKIDEEKKGIQRAEVVSAIPLEDDEKKLLASGLKRITGKHVIVQSRVDPSIVGGVIVYVNGDVIDGSVRGQLEELRDLLLASAMD